MVGRDPRTKTDWSRTVRFGLGPRTGPGKNSNLGPNQDRKNFENLGPISTGRSPGLAVRGSLIVGAN